MEELGRRIQELGHAARALSGADDVAQVRRLKWSARIAEAIGRVCFQFVPGPVGWLAGTSALSYYFSVEAQLNHSIQHGAYVGLPGAGPFTPRRYETLAVPFQCRTWREAHRIHHAHPSLVNEDPDTAHPLFRVHESLSWRPWHRLNSFLGALFTFEAWAFDYDRFLKRRGHRSPGDRRELGKFALYVAYQFVLFPLLAGANWKSVLAGALVATAFRNVLFSSLQTASSVGHEVSTRHARSFEKKRATAFFRFQIETSKNFVIPEGWRALVGGLDRHIEHHLYPQLPPSQLHALSPRVRALCEEHGLRYSEHASLGHSLEDGISYLWRLSRE
jgi:NADPH-dependent stearoyl-CoA 9-desaturase